MSIAFLLPYNPKLEEKFCMSVYHGERYAVSKNPRKPQMEPYIEYRQGNLKFTNNRYECHIGIINYVD